MKPLILMLIWALMAFFALTLLYAYIPSETQYAMAEHFEFYGDEQVMDFVLFVFSGAALLVASLLTLGCYLLFKHK